MKIAAVLRAVAGRTRAVAVTAFPRRALSATAAALVRGFALFAGSFLLLDAAFVEFGSRSGAAVWLVDARQLPSGLRTTLAVAAGCALVAWSVRGAAGRAARSVAAVVAVALAVAAATDALRVLRLDASGRFVSSWVPLSAVTAAAFAAVAFAAARGGRVRPVPLRATALAALVCAAAFPVAQIATFGRSDYRRSADAIVVFGARAYADGRPSTSLKDRMSTACALFHEGRAPTLIVSGGPGDGAVHETESMRRFAVAEGVPDAAIVVDTDGLDTRATVRGVAAWLRARGSGRVLAVSHGYHLPRVKLEFERAHVEARTVPARESRAIAKTPWFVAREVAAWWVAWARAPGV